MLPAAGSAAVALLLLALLLLGPPATTAQQPSSRRRLLQGWIPDARPEVQPGLPIPAAANLSLFPAPPPAHSDTSHAYVALCTVVKDQNHAIREWVYYHHWLGVRKIYLYDHESARPLEQDLIDWVNAGVVDVHRFAGHHAATSRKVYNQSLQGFAFAHCLERARGCHKWAAFIDGDEFLVLNGPANTRDLPALLREYEPFGGLAVNWRIFSSSGHVRVPAQPVLLAYTSCFPDTHQLHNTHVKTIAHVDHTAGIGGNPHTFRYREGYGAVTERFLPCGEPWCKPVSLNRIALHHYVIKSLAEFRSKMARGGGSGSRKRMQFYDSIQRSATAQCFHGVRAFQECCGHLPWVGNQVEEAAAAGAGGRWLLGRGQSG